MITQALLEQTLQLARDAGNAVMEVYQRDFDIELKADNSPVTEADLLAHRIIVQGLRELTPDIPILSEENADIDWAIRQTWQRYWLVDPIDGTKEFINKNGEFTINIALIEQNTPILGVIDAPALNVSYLAAQNLGAFKDDGVKRSALKVSARKHDELIRAVGSRSHPSPTTQTYLEERYQHIELVGIGSSLKFCLIAESKADIYPKLGPICEWDTAAGHVIAQTAGATINQLNGEPLTYNTKESYLHPHFVVSGLSE